MIPSKLPTPLEVIAPLLQQVECSQVHRPSGHDANCSYALRGGGDCDCGVAYPYPPQYVEPPIDAQDKVRQQLIALRIEEKELLELLSTNRALQLQYEAQILPF